MEQDQIFLEKILDITNADNVYGQLQGILKNQELKKIVISAKNIIKIDTSGMQLLLGFIIYLKEHSISYIWKDLPNILIEHAKLLGLYEHLDLDKSE